jgi:diadenosine tetraphosphate (Ap4A) HIT family hydrolase
MPEPASEFHARILAAAVDGRLPAPAMSQWDIFPWEVVDGAVAPKVLAGPGPEAPRAGEEGGGPCPACAGFGPERLVWEDDHWQLTADPLPSGLPLVLTLWSREHLDTGDLDDDQAGEFGRIANRLVRIVQGLPHIGRVHVNRWGDGCSHFHVWFVARPEGFEQIKGSYAVEWDDILPPVDEAVWRSDLHTVATKLANWSGHARAQA